MRVIEFLSANDSKRKVVLEEIWTLKVPSRMALIGDLNWN
jgi:hypothetical protein